MKNRLHDMKIGQMLKRSFAILIIFASIVGISSIYSIFRVGAKAEHVNAIAIEKVTALKTIQGEITEYEAAVYQSMSSLDLKKSVNILEEAEIRMDGVVDGVKAYGAESKDEVITSNINGLYEDYLAAKKLERIVLEAYKADADDNSLYDMIQNEFRPTIIEMNRHAQALVDNVDEEVAAELLGVKIVGISAIIFNVILLIGMILYAIKMTKDIVATISEPLKDIEEAMNKLSNGEFSVELQYTSENEFGSLANSIRNTINRLNKYIGIEEEILEEIANMNMNVSIEEEFVGDFKIMQNSIEKIIAAMNDMFLKTRSTAEVIDGASEQVSSVAQALAVSATQQAASMEELVATINQITDNVTDNAKMADQMSVSAKVVHEKVEHGKECMDELHVAMEEISKKSEDISEIIEVINDIADQTNLLSLNASIEASRAGDFGRGFGVVASEIGKLALQCAEAVKDTERLVKDSIKAVAQGNIKVEESLKLMQEIVVSNEENSKCIEEVSSVCNQQAAALEQTLAGSNQIAEAIQENSGMAEESSASSEELTAQVVELNQMLQRCQIKE